jgi:lipopolysaccharide/colanic/teichoic acid biosynthesis glycosyltransferase
MDELPQLWNVFVGHMSFVGPRPDVPGYADLLGEKDRRLLELYPGITGPATLRFRDEETLLSTVTDPQRYNDEVLYPEKVKINLAYLDNWSFWNDMGYILLTIAPGISQLLGIGRRLGFSSEPLSPVRESDNFSHIS